MRGTVNLIRSDKTSQTIHSVIGVEVVKHGTEQLIIEIEHEVSGIKVPVANITDLTLNKGDTLYETNAEGHTVHAYRVKG